MWLVGVHDLQYRRRRFLIAVIATSVVAYAETRATLARLRREHVLTPAALRAATAQFEIDWPAFFAVPVSPAVLDAAGALADRLHLRGFDSIHLASFERVMIGAGGEDDVEFESADARLLQAAKHLG